MASPCIHLTACHLRVLTSQPVISVYPSHSLLPPCTHITAYHLRVHISQHVASVYPPNSMTLPWTHLTACHLRVPTSQHVTSVYPPHSMAPPSTHLTACHLRVPTSQRVTRGLDVKKYCTYSITLINKTNSFVRSFVHLRVLISQHVTSVYSLHSRSGSHSYRCRCRQPLGPWLWLPLACPWGPPE